MVLSAVLFLALRLRFLLGAMALLAALFAVALVVDAVVLPKRRR